MILNKRTQKIAALGLATLVGTGVIATTVDASSLTKTQKTTYNNIKVTYNGNSVTPVKEPFTIDGTVYVSLRDAGEITGNQVTWGSNTVQLTSNGSSDLTNQVILQKDLEIATLSAKLKDAEAKIKQLETKPTTPDKTDPSSSSDIKKVLKTIQDEYNDYKKVDWTFDLKEKSSKLYLTVSYESRYDKNDFANISTATLDKFLEDICDDISYAFNDMEIRGELIDETKDTTMSTFNYSTKGKFTSSRQYSKSDLDTLEDDLNDDYTKLASIPYDKFKDATIYIDDITLTAEDDYETVNFEIEIRLTPEQKTNWNNLTTSDVRGVKDQLEDIYDDIDDTFDLERINGYIKCDGKVILKYEGQQITLRSFS